LKLTVLGTTLTAYYNGIQIAQGTDSAIDGVTVGGKQCGLGMTQHVAGVTISYSEFRFGV
jgi:hypothetical protein